MPDNAAKKYRGSTRRLVISFDVGTTFSGVSYTFLEPGEQHKIYSVTRFPGQENVAGAPKVPSILYYDKQGNMRAAGAEVNSAENVERADDEEWIKIEWFKLRMRPKSMPTKLRSSNLPPLPPGKNLLQVFGDYMSYLMKCTSSFIRDTHPNIPAQTFEQLRSKAEFIIAHPNGWEGAQQARLRKAAVLGGLVPDTAAGKSRVSFVSEGEASLHYCIGEGLVGDEQKGFLIADLGGGTLDFSAYEVTGVSPLRVREMAAAKCDLEGSSFVTLRAKGFLQKKLEKSRYGTGEHINLIATRFDETAKRTFRSSEELCLIQFGSVADSDPSAGIRRGNLRLTGTEVQELFEPSIRATIDAVRAQKNESKRPISALYLVGGFSASPYLISTLKQRLQADGLQVSIPDSQTAKAVADGAISYYLDGHVSSRVARVTYGAPAGVPYNAFDPEHLRRTDFHRHLPSGRVVVNGGFEVVLERGTTVDEEKEFRRPFFDETTSWETLNNLSLDVIAYSGSGRPPKWIDETDPNLFKKVFKVQADTSTLQHVLQYQRAPDGTMYWRYDFALVIKFGSPELKAQLVWNENGVERRSPAQIVYEEEINPEMDLDEDDNGEEAGLDDDDEHHNIAAVDMGLTARRDDAGRPDLANRMHRTRPNDPVRRSMPPPPHNPVEPDAGSGRGGEDDDDHDSPDSPSGGRGGGGIRAPNTNSAANVQRNHPPHLQAMVTGTQVPRRRPSQIRPEVDARGEARPGAVPGAPAERRSSRASVSSTASRASRASTSTDNADTGAGTLADGIGALLMQEENDGELEADLPCYPDADEDARRVATQLDAEEQRSPPDAHHDPTANTGDTSPPAYPAELLPFINDTSEKHPPP